jgi:hypothetical protein
MLSVHGTVREVTRATSKGGWPDGRMVGMGMKVFKTG